MRIRSTSRLRRRSRNACVDILSASRTTWRGGFDLENTPNVTDYATAGSASSSPNGYGPGTRAGEVRSDPGTTTASTEFSFSREHLGQPRVIRQPAPLAPPHGSQRV